jgi:hypothetical protein
MRATMVARVCGQCESWPCRCELGAPTYRPHGPWETTCACSLVISAATRSDEDVQQAVLRHNVEPVHLAWRERVGIA